MPALLMEDAVFDVHFPAGNLPARGFSCSACGQETLLPEEADRLQGLARDVGLFGIENERGRRLIRTGGSLAVTLDPELVREVLHDAKQGSLVLVGRQGGKIVIRPANGA